MYNDIYLPPLPDLSAINRNLAWMTDPNFRALIDNTYQAIISNQGEKPFVITIYDELCKIIGSNKRLNVAYEIKDNLISYLESRYKESNERKKQVKEFNSLIHFLQVLDRIDCDKNIEEFYRKNPNIPIQRLNSFTYYYSLNKHIDHDEFLWFSQLHFHFAHIEKTSIDTTYLPLYTNCFKNIYVAHPAIYFCQSLIEAQHFIDKALKGENCPPVTVKSFLIHPRIYCFDKYVESLSKEKLKELLKDNDRQDIPDDDEAKEELLRDELKACDKVVEKPSINQEAVKMARYLIERLKDDLGLSDKSQPYCTYSLPDATKTRDEIEIDLRRASKHGAPRFARLLLHYEKQNLLDFRGDSPREIFDYMSERYDLEYTAGQFIRNFKR